MQFNYSYRCQRQALHRLWSQNEDKFASFQVKYIKIRHYFLNVISILFSKQISDKLMLPKGLSSVGVPGVPWHPQILADWLTLSQPRGADYAHQIILAPTDFQTFRRPCAASSSGSDKFHHFFHFFDPDVLWQQLHYSRLGDPVRNNKLYFKRS